MADPTLYLYTSLTAGSSHIITATSRLETILKANKIPFRALDCATDEKARTIWSRRSRGRKLPGLVKFGQVIGDLEQIEEWNEFGELHEQIESADDFLDGAEAPPNPNAISLRPEPGPGVANTLTPIQPASGSRPDQKSNASSRASSETRHISISEPAGKEPSAKSPTSTPGNPMAMTMRQLGAEAAAKAKEAQRKPSGTTAAPPTSAPSEKTDELVEAASAQAKEREVSDPAVEPEVTAAKTPAVLAAEGAKRTSVDKIDAKTPSTSAPTSARATTETSADDVEPAVTSPTKSTEEQVLDLRRQSTQINQPSNLHESISADSDGENEAKEQVKAAASATAATEAIEEDVEPPAAEAMADATPTESKTETAIADEVPSTDATADAATEKGKPTDAGEVIGQVSTSDSLGAPEEPRAHRGSSVEVVDEQEIKKIEAATAIAEHPEEDEEAVAEPVSKSSDETAVKADGTDAADSTDKSKDVEEAPEEPVKESPTVETTAKDDPADVKAEKPQDTAAKDPDATSKSVED